MNCAQFEILLADHVDGTLASPGREGEREEFLRHLESCADCAALAEDVTAAMTFMERAAPVEPPSHLVTKILHATNGGWELKLRGGGIRGWINRTFAPVLQPRFVMGAVLTLISATMLTQCAGVHSITAAQLDPVRIWTSLDDRTHRIWGRAVKSYQSIRVVYEVKNQLDDWAKQQREQDEAAADAKARSRELPEIKTPDTKKQNRK
jgi:hypothetical protein